MKIKRIYRGLFKIAKNNDINIHKVEDVYNFQRHKMYNREYKKTFCPDLKKIDVYAYKIIKRYYDFKNWPNNNI